MANYTRNAIYTYVRNAIIAEYPSIYVTGTAEPIPPQDNAVQIMEVDRRRPTRYATLDSLDKQWRVAFDANVYSNLYTDSTTDAYEIMAVVEQAFRELHFFEESCTVLELSNNRVTRLTARFSRTIGVADQMPE